ncbi:MAG: hypothetical protein MJ239_05640 [Bacilli bacterium]|nr:hypothetical protein [Bacilli bacterium]
MSFTLKYLGKEQTFEQKVALLDLVKDIDPDRNFIAARVNKRVRDLQYEVYYDAEIEFLTTEDETAVKIYEATLRFILAKAFHRLYPDLHIKFAYNVSRCVSIHLLDTKYHADTAMLLKVQHEVESIIKEDIPFIRQVVSNEEAAKFYRENGLEDKLGILAYRPEKTVHFYACGKYKNYMYSHLLPSTGYIKKYKIRLWAPGFLLQYPRAELGGKIPEFQDSPTFGRVLTESHNWAKTIGAQTIAEINRQIEERGPIEFLNISEARHNRQLCELGQMIQDDIHSIRLICVAGPSSSGKTTFANRLRIELLSRGIKPIRISLDDYYKDKGDPTTPVDEFGNKDFESIDALDVDAFNRDMLNLINGEEVTLPRFDFHLGKKVEGRTIKLGEDEPIIIEGIHALNNKMTIDIPKSVKFKIYIAPQAQLNIDNQNPVSLTDLRLLRRIVRDKRDRDSSAEDTIMMWPSVRRGEFKWIYDTQEGCDFVYNSLLAYELPVMKKYALPVLQAIDRESPAFPVAERLIRMLKFFVDMEDSWVPSNSLMREFIGGSCYADV